MEGFRMVIIDLGEAKRPRIDILRTLPQAGRVKKGH
jgi:hypothetical protein